MPATEIPKKARLNKYLASVLKILILTDELKRAKTETSTLQIYIGIFLEEQKMLSKLFFVGVLLAGLFCSVSVVLAKEDGTEDCDAVALEKVLAQARGITASATFLSEIKPVMDDTKKLVEMVIAENFRKQEEAFAEENGK